MSTIEGKDHELRSPLLICILICLLFGPLDLLALLQLNIMAMFLPSKKSILQVINAIYFVDIASKQGHNDVGSLTPTAIAIEVFIPVLFLAIVLLQPL